MTTILEVQTTLFGKQEAAVSRFFISPESRPSGKIIDMINGLEETRTASSEAKTRLSAIGKQAMEASRKQMTSYVNRGIDGEVPPWAAHVNRLQDAAYCYDDACSTIQKAGADLADVVKGNMTKPMEIINGQPYWLERDRQGRSWLCSVDAATDSAIYFNRYDETRDMIGRSATVNDYATLIMNIDLTMGEPS